MIASFQVISCNQSGELSYLDDEVNLKLQNALMNLDESITNMTTRQFVKSIPAYSLVSDFLYQIKVNSNFQRQLITQFKQVTFSLSAVPTNFVTSLLEVKYQLSELYIQLVGGNRFVNYKKPFSILSQLADYEEINASNSQSGILSSWACSNISGTPCLDSSTLLPLIIPNTQNLTFTSFQFSPYTVIKLKLTGTKQYISAYGNQTRSKSKEIFVLVIEMDIPPLEVITDFKTNADSTINLNQIIHTKLNYDSVTNPNNLYYSGAILYNGEVVTTMEFQYSHFRFQIWDYYSEFVNTNLDFQIRFSAYNPQYIQPSITTLSFTLNFPPTNCKLLIESGSASQFALETIFKIKMLDCQDNHTPLKYQFFYYHQPSDFTFEKQNDLKIQRNQLNDRSSSFQLNTVLPQGNILILAQAIDSREAISNVTLNISLTSRTYSQSEYSTFVIDFITNTQNQIAEQQIVYLNFLTKDIISKGASLLSSSDLNSIKLQIISLIKSASALLLQTSNLGQLGQQTITSLLSSQIEMDIGQKTSQLNFLKEGLSLIEGNCTSSEQSQSKYQRCIENIFINFNSIDGLSKTTGQKQTSLDDSFIKQAESIGDILNKFALPNENSIIYKGQNMKILSQKITSKFLINYIGISQQMSLDSETDNDEEIYDVSIKTYKTNFYASDPSFSEYQANITSALNTTKMTTVFPVINPQIKISSNSSLLASKKGNSVSFQNLEPNKALTCFSKSSNNNWVTSGCLTNFNKEIQQIQCICQKLSPTTIVEDISSLFTNNANLNTAFGSDGIANLSNFTDFYRYVVFWVLLFQTGALIGLIVKARKLDQISEKKFSPKLINKEQEEKEISKQQKEQSKESTKVHPIEKTLSIPEKKAESPTFIFTDINSNSIQTALKKNQQIIGSEQLENQKQLFSNQQNMCSDLKVEEKEPQTLSQDSENTPPKKDSQQMLNNENESQFLFEINNKKSNILILNEDPLKKKRRVRIINRIQKSDKEERITQNIQEQEKIKALDEIQNAKQLRQGHKEKIQKIGDLFFFLYFHDFFSIFLVYMANLSRQIRFILFYLRYTHTLTISIMFSSLAKSTIQIIFVSLFSSIVIIVFSKIITVLLQKSGFLKKIGALFTMLVVTFYLYLILSVQSGQPFYKSNLFISNYVSFLAIDVLFSQTLTAIILGIVAKKVLKASEDSNRIVIRFFDFLKLNVIINSIIRLN